MRLIIIIFAAIFLIACPPKPPPKPKVIIMKFEIAPELKDKDITIRIYPRRKKQ